MTEILRTPRLVLREAVLSDAGFMLQLVNSPKWLAYIGDRGIRNPGDAENYITGNLQRSYRENGFGLYVITLTSENQPAGICGFLKREYLEFPDLGFALLPGFEGRGLAREAAQAALRYGRDARGFAEVLAITKRENMQSRRLLSELGFAETGTVRPEPGAEILLLYSSLPVSEGPKPGKTA